MVHETPSRAPSRRRNIPALAYHLLVGSLGLAVLVVLGLRAEHMPDWLTVATFTLLSIGVKSLGFRVVRKVTHSLVGIVDLAALFTFGPFGGALVAAVSSGVCRAADAEHGQLWPTGGRWQAVLFTSGLNVLKLAAAGGAYAACGGALPLAVITWRGLLPVLVASVTLFTVDHIFWAASTFFLEGRTGLVYFVQNILPYSLLVELMPLPVSAAVAAARHTSGPLFLIIGVTVLAVSYVLQTLMVSLSRERRHVRELSTISALGHGLLNARLDVHSLCGLIYRSSLQIVATPVFALQLQETGESPALVYAMVGQREASLPDPLFAADTFVAVAQARQALVVPDFADSSLKPLPLGPAARSGLYVPVIRGDELLGVLSLQSPEKDAFTPEDRAAVELLAAQAAMGLQTTRLYQRERQRATQLLAIARVSRKVAAIQGLPDLFADTARLVADTFGYYHVTIFTADPEAQRIQFEAASSAYIQQRGLNAPWGEGLIGNAARDGRTILANDVALDPRFRSDDALPETLSEITVPLMAEGRLVGVLDVQSNERDAFSENDRFVLETLGAQVAIAIEHNRMHQAQQVQAWVSTALQQAAEAIAANPATPEDALDAVARLALMLAGVERCVIFTWADEAAAYTALASEGWSRAQTARLRSATYAAGSVPILDRLRTEGQVLCTHAADLAAVLPTEPADEGHSGRVIGLPLRSKGEFVGAMLVQELDGEAPPSEHHLTILIGIANHAALGLDNARLYASQREEAWVSTALLQVANSINTTLDLTDAAATVARLVPMLVGVDWCAILVWDEERGAISARHAYGLPEAAVEALMSGANGCVQDVLGRDEPLLVDDPVAAGWLPAGALPDGARGRVAALPLRARSKRLGVLLAGHGAAQGFPGRSLSILSGIANQTSLAIEAAELYAQTLAQQRLEREMELAQEIQQAFLPETIPALAGWQVAVAWRAARGVGGDYYDFVPLENGRLGFLIADVSDKGVGAALYMALSRAVIRAAALAAAGPAETLERANRVLAADNRSGMFVSLFYAVLDPASGALCYARAGHNPPLWRRCRQGDLRALCPPGAVLGITDDPGIVEETITLEADDLLVMYTDGVTDAVNAANEEFGEERLEALVRAKCGATAEEVIADVDRAVTEFAGGRQQFDDFTLLVLRRG